MAGKSRQQGEGTVTFMGIDPGKSGALAILREGSVEVVPFDPEAYLAAFRSLVPADTRCVLEHVGSMPGNSGLSMFSFGENFGIIQGMLTATGIPFQLVRPQRWKKEYTLDHTKEKSIEVCKRLFPGVNLKRTDRSRKDDDNIAEAVLMAEYARRHL